MTSNIVARRYAKALFELGEKSGLPELERYSASLAELREMVTASTDLSHVFSNTIFTPTEKKGVLTKVAKKAKIGGAILNFCLLLADKGRLSSLSEIVAVFDEMLDIKKGILRGELFTAVSLDDAKKTAVTTQLAGQANRTLVLNFGVAPDIIGGVVLKVGDLVMDASLRAQLSILKDTIKRGE